MRLHVTRYLCGTPLLHNSSGVGLINGFPSKILFLKELIDSEKLEDVKFALTLLGLSRTLIPKRSEIIPISYESISTPGPVKEYIIPRGFIRKFLLDRSIRKTTLTYSKENLFLNVKQGPAGPSTMTIIQTIRYLNYNQMQWILNIVGETLFSNFEKLHK